MKKRKHIPFSIKAELIRDIGAECPFPSCGNEDVGHFQVHHIDENPTNNNKKNLLMCCPICHSKITKGQVTKEIVIKVKAKPKPKNNNIDIYKISINKERCSWRKYPKVENAFYLDYDRDQSELPILQFHFLNNFKRTVVIHDVDMIVTPAYSKMGMGDPYIPGAVPYGDIYKIKIDEEYGISSLEDFPGIQIPSSKSYIFQIQVYESEDLESDFNNAPVDPVGLIFIFSFSNGTKLVTEPIALNTENRDFVPKLQYLN